MQLHFIVVYYTHIQLPACLARESGEKHSLDVRARAIYLNLNSLGGETSFTFANRSRMHL